MIYITLVLLLCSLYVTYRWYTQRTKAIPSAVTTPPTVKKKRKKVKIYEVLRITAGRNHAWCGTNVGIIRKPLSSIPSKTLRAHHEYLMYGV